MLSFLFCLVLELLDIPLDENWEVPRDSIDIKELAGEGAFGYVAKAKAFQLPNKVSTPCIVAVKMLKGYNHFYRSCHVINC